LLLFLILFLFFLFLFEIFFDVGYFFSVLICKVKTTIFKGTMEIISYTLPPITNNRWWRDA
jgi:hypothetical protein